ncbi:MAG: hypothetical protein HYY13_04655 [Nitrospirae bacterium]|nr:hypothetical protein [Nitrospirota bacterium]
MGLHPTPAGDGPAVIYDLTHKPLPDIPFPNDSATRPDSSSPTGRRVSLSLAAPTALERQIRLQANELTGFSLYGPITVSFSEPLDVGLFKTHHLGNRSAEDDLLYLINIDRASPHFGSLVPLELGQGNFPLLIDHQKSDPDDPFGIFENDPKRFSSNILFETTEEDANGNGSLDEGEDADFDGVLDHPNVWDPSHRPIDQDRDLLAFYERETRTLTARPVLPLDQRTTYAVVLTRRLLGENGQAVRSPFPYVHHLSQTSALSELPAALAVAGLNLGWDGIAFAWSFTTQDATGEMEAIRAGLYGRGPYAWLADRFPPDVELDPLASKLNPDFGITSLYRIPARTLEQLFRLAVQVAPDLLSLLTDAADAGQFVDEFFKPWAFIDYFVAGTYLSPNFMVDRDGIAEAGYPADDDETFKIDARSGLATVGEGRGMFFCAVPKQVSGRTQPFPVAFLPHGYGGSRLAAVLQMGVIAQYGFASCGVDAFSSGLAVILGENLPLTADDIRSLIKPFGMDPFWDNLILKGRARDLNNDGFAESAGDLFTPDLYHTRDALRQTMVDYLQLVRAMRGWDGVRRGTQDLDGDGQTDLAGDFDGNGLVDFGGPLPAGAKYYMTGCSLGGITTGLLSGIEPALSATAPMAGAAGLSDVAMRTVQPRAVEAVYLPLFGPMIVGNPVEGGIEVKYLALDVYKQAHLPFLVSDKINPGDRVELHNLVNGEWDWTVVGPDKKFRLAVAADALTATEKRHLLGQLGKPKPPAHTPDLTGDETLATGDALEIRVCDGPSYSTAPCSPVRVRFRRHDIAFTYQGARYAEGSRLTALHPGFGFKRNRPPLRRFLSIAQTALDPGDPVAYAPHYFTDPLDFSYDPDIKPEDVPVPVLVVNTVGDMNVPISSGISIARAAGVIDLTSEKADTGGRTENEIILDHFVAEGAERLRRFSGPPWSDDRSILFDLDDLDDGTDSYRAPDLRAEGYPPLRVMRATPNGVSGMRIPYMRDTGQHCFGPSNPSRPFNVENFIMNQAAAYFLFDGRRLPDDACLATSSCDFTPQAP